MRGYRFEILLSVLFVLSILFSFTGMRLLNRVDQLERRREELKKALIRKEKLGLTQDELKYILMGIFGSDVRVKLKCEKDACTAEISSNRVEYPVFMDSLLKLSSLFEVTLNRMCIGVECPITYFMEVEIYARKHSGSSS